MRLEVPPLHHGFFISPERKRKNLSWVGQAGSVLIGLAATLFILLNGRIAGASGVIGGLLRPLSGDVVKPGIEVC